MNDLTLPELSDQRIDEIEAALFARIAQDRGADAATQAARRSRSARRGRIWMGATGAAAVVAIAAFIGPQLVVGSSAGSVADESRFSGAYSAPDTAAGADGGVASGATEDMSGAAATDVNREIIATASATVEVDDTRVAAEQVSAAAVADGGYVESMSIGGTGADTSADGYRGDGAEIYPASGAWITVRIPADQLTSAIAGLEQVGDVTTSRIDRQDVTTEVVDLRARVAALQASVDRLTTLMKDAMSTADLLAAESALAARQSELDSLQQQLTYLDDQVGFSSLTVTLVEPAPAVTADPAGFGDGFVAGWNGLLATLNGVVVGLGFLFPWLAVAAVILAIVWAVRRARRRRGGRAEGDGASASDS